MSGIDRQDQEMYKKTVELGKDGTKDVHTESKDDAATDTEYCPYPSDDEVALQITRKRRRFKTKYTPTDNEMTHQYLHLRQIIHKVHPKVYENIGRLKGSYHMSQNEAQGAVVLAGNKMFGRNGELYSSDKLVVDLNTLPDSSNTRKAGKAWKTWR